MSCGGSVEKVKPTPNSAFRSTYPCELLTRQMASDLLAISGPRRIGAQTLQKPGSVKLEQCIWARGRYNVTPQIALLISPATYMFAKDETVASRQRRAEKLDARYPRRRGKRWPGYRALSGIGDRAYLESFDRTSSTVVVEQDGKSFELTLRLHTKPRSQPPPLTRLESMARAISARYTHPPG